MNLKILNDFEKDIHKPVSSLSTDELKKYLNNENILAKYFRNIDAGIELVTSILEKNNVAKSWLNLVYYQTILTKIQIELFELSSEDRYGENLLKKYLETKEPLYKLSLVFELISNGIRTEFSPEEQREIEGNIKGITDYLKVLQINDESYLIFKKLLNLVFKVKNILFLDCNISIKMGDLSSLLDNLHEYEFKKFRDSTIPSIPIKPEELGYIDITRF